MKTIMIAAACALALAGCNQTTGGASAPAITAANAQVVKLNGRVADAGQVLQTYCPYLELIAALAGSVSSQKHVQVVSQAQAAVNVACAAPVTDVTSAAVVAIAAYNAAKAAGVAQNVAPQ